MVAPQIFKILTEFKFDIASAAANTEAIRGHLDRLNATVEDVKSNLAGLGQNFLFTFGLGGGVAGLLHKAVMASEEFSNAQRQLGGIMLANREFLVGPIDDFNSRLAISKSILNDISDSAMKFGLPEKDLAAMTKLLAAFLTPKGLSGTNFNVPIEMSRNLLKSAPNLGVDPSQVEGQMLRIIEGAADRGDTLFRRLAGETQAFKPFADPKKFNVLPVEKRLAVLREGLNQFAAAAVKAENPLNSITGSMNRLSSLFTGSRSVLMPMGDALKPHIVNALKRLATTLDGPIRGTFENIGQSIRMALQDGPERAILNFMQLMQFPKDLQRAGGMFAQFGIMEGLMGIGRFFGLSLKAVNILGILGTTLIGLFEGWARLLETSPLLKKFMEILATIMKVVAVLGVVALILAKFGVLGMVATAIGTMLPVFAFFLVLSMAISRAIAKAQIGDAKALPGFIESLTRTINHLWYGLQLLAQPFIMLLDLIADMLAPIFSIQTSGSLFISTLTALGSAMAAVGEIIVRQEAIISGVFASIVQFLANIAAVWETRGLKGFLFDRDVPGLLTSGVGDAFSQEFQRFVSMAMGSVNTEGGLATVNNTTNIGKVEIKNAFKETADPDRIAFTIQDQLMKAAINPRGAKGRSFSGGLVPQAVSGS